MAFCASSGFLLLQCSQHWGGRGNPRNVRMRRPTESELKMSQNRNVFAESDLILNQTPKMNK